MLVRHLLLDTADDRSAEASRIVQRQSSAVCELQQPLACGMFQLKEKEKQPHGGEGAKRHIWQA